MVDVGEYYIVGVWTAFYRSGCPGNWCPQSLLFLTFHGICRLKYCDYKKILFFTWFLHASEAFICKAFNGAVIVGYYNPLITQQMGASGSCKVQVIILYRLSFREKDRNGIPVCSAAFFRFHWWRFSALMIRLFSLAAALLFLILQANRKRFNALSNLIN